MRRDLDDRVLGGVAAGICRQLGWKPGCIRIAFVIAAAVGGVGAIAYVILWLAIPARDDEQSLGLTVLRDPRKRAAAIFVAALLVPALLVLRWLIGGYVGGLVFQFGLAAAGVGIVWAVGSAEERETLERLADSVPARAQASRLARLRLLIGGSLVFFGLAGLLLQWGSVEAMRGAALGTMVVLGGVALVFGPWWLRLARELAEERRSRVRSQERAEVATHLHDSVLQTLALIQRAADDPRRVTTLARRQERELRAWLFGTEAAEATDRTLSGMIASAATEIEGLTGTPVEVVTVGDATLDEDVTALVAATREAMLNAAKWSGAASIAVYVEVESEPPSISVFVRDRGQGFDQAAVAPDRRGISESIVGRMQRHGGSGVVRTTPGAGTEVELRLGRRAA